MADRDHEQGLPPELLSDPTGLTPAQPHYVSDMASYMCQGWIDARDFLTEESYDPNLQRHWILQNFAPLLKLVVERGGLQMDLLPRILSAARCSRQDVEQAIIIMKRDYGYREHPGLRAFNDYIHGQFTAEFDVRTEPSYRLWKLVRDRPPVEDIEDVSWTEDALSLDSDELPSVDDDMYEEDQEEDEE
jgi:hypothetical protein